MAQFTIYTSEDTGAPILGASSGSLLNLFDKVLVTGYGTKPGAGWIRTFPHTGSIGCFNINTASINLSASFLVINDAAPGLMGVREARAWGYTSVTAIIGSNVTGSGIFPTSSQATAIFIKKASSLTDAYIPWIVFADSRSLYCYTNYNTYASFFFGDITPAVQPPLSSSHTYRTMIVGRDVEGGGTDLADKLQYMSALGTTLPAHYMARKYNNLVAITTSYAVGKHGQYTSAGTLPGILPVTNCPDNGFYISPLWIHGGDGSIIGKMRGFYQLCHSNANYMDRRIINGSGYYAGKTFMFVGPLPFCMEISNTLD
jgi:hypothetical protein